LPAVRTPLLITGLCAALALTGCGETNQNERARARQAVEGFALASGPEACKYLGGQALEDNYGGRDYATGIDRCHAASKKFEGEAVTVQRVQITSDTTARVDALSKDGRLYVVSLSKPQDDWVIERIVQQRKQ
jgi:hypothetical protein